MKQNTPQKQNRYTYQTEYKRIKRQIYKVELQKQNYKSRTTNRNEVKIEVIITDNIS